MAIGRFEVVQLIVLFSFVVAASVLGAQTEPMRVEACRNGAGGCVASTNCSVPTFRLRDDGCPPELVCCPRTTVNFKDIHILPATEHYRTTTEQTVYLAEDIEDVTSTVSFDEFTTAKSDHQGTTTENTTPTKPPSTYKPPIDDYTEKRGSVNHHTTESTNTADNTPAWLAEIYWMESPRSLRHCCNGVLISRHAVLTTASCWEKCKHLAGLWSVKIGALTPYPEEFKVQKGIMNRNWIQHNFQQKQTAEYNIAILHLHSTEQYGSSMQPVRLPVENESFDTDEISLLLFHWDQYNNLTMTRLEKVEPRYCGHQNTILSERN
uniref:Peptidase S1 domain-containing protein n=1 Tax=Anopheles albimanus TaxID=7167 RepID=A0A182FVB1_ANOAL